MSTQLIPEVGMQFTLKAGPEAVFEVTQDSGVIFYFRMVGEDPTALRCYMRSDEFNSARVTIVLVPVVGMRFRMKRYPDQEFQITAVRDGRVFFRVPRAYYGRLDITDFTSELVEEIK